MNPRKIITYVEHPYPPIAPFWIAYYDGDEGDEYAPRGMGPTQDEAIRDLTDSEVKL